MRTNTTDITNTLTLTRDGQIDPRSVEQLSRANLRAWIDARLHGQDSLAPGGAGRGEMPHYLLTVLFPDLDREVRRDVTAIVCDFLEDMAQNPQSSWRGAAANELLLLAQKVADREGAACIAAMADEGRFHVPNGGDEDGDAQNLDLHFRLLQSLVALRWSGPRAEDFWLRQFERDPARYGGVVFRGLTQVSAQRAFALLPKLDWNPKVTNQILTLLPGLVREQAEEYVVPLLARYLPELPPHAQEAIRQFFDARGTPLPIETRRSPDYGPALQKLRLIDANKPENEKFDFSPKPSRLVPDDSYLYRTAA